MASLEELEAVNTARLRAREAEADDEESDDDDAYDEQEEALQDLEKSFELLTKCMHLLDYMSDPVMVPTLSKREREAMARLSDAVQDYMDETQPNYEKVEEEKGK